MAKVLGREMSQGAVDRILAAYAPTNEFSEDGEEEEYSVELLERRIFKQIRSRVRDYEDRQAQASLEPSNFDF